MTDKERLGLVIDELVAMRRDRLRLTARLKALESLVRSKIPKDKRPAWDKLLDEQTNGMLQRFLESVENADPAFATLLDKRASDELNGIDVSLPPG